jgi:hypothetical protein
VLSLSWAAVCARRLERHGLTAPLQQATPAEIVGAMCGAHAQVMAAAELSIGLRIAGITRAEVQDALWRERSLVKTRGPCGTVHLLPTQNLPMWTGALSAMPPSRNIHGRNELLTPEQTEAIVAAIADALEDAELTADEVGAKRLRGQAAGASTRGSTSPSAQYRSHPPFSTSVPRATKPSLVARLQCIPPHFCRRATNSSFAFSTWPLPMYCCCRRRCP